MKQLNRAGFVKPRACSDNVHYRNGLAFSLGHSPCPQLWTLWHAAIHSPSLWCDGLYPVIHVCTWITNHLPIPEGWKAKLAYLADP